MDWLYRVGAEAYHLSVRAAAEVGNEKARQWVTGRRRDVSAEIRRLHDAGTPILWLHAASLGEFEQGRPVLRAFREEHPDWAVVLTFFSPSGYERCHSTELAEVVTYLPQDGPDRAARWIDLLSPSLAVFVKYEFWFYHLTALQRAGVPTLLVAGSFRRSQPFFKWYGTAWRRMLDCFSHFGVQTDHDARLLQELGYHNITRTGDPRVDRTLKLAQTPFNDGRLDAFTSERPTLFAGSVWPADVEVIREAWPRLCKHWRLILAPHQLDETQLRGWQAQFDAERYTGTDDGKDVLLLDTIGILSRAYRYGRVAFVGGGYGGSGGLHNTLEPMSYGLPVCFGPRYGKFPEAGAAVERGGAFAIDSSRTLIDRLEELSREAAYDRARAAQKAYIREQSGAAGRSLALLSRYLLLLVVFTTNLSAQNWTPAEEMVTTLDGLYAKCNLMVAVASVGWRPGLCLGGAELQVGQTASLDLTLRTGYTYIFIAGSEGAASDIDLVVRDGEDLVIASDTETDATPILEFTVDSTARYRVQVHLVAGDSIGSMVGLGLLRSEGGDLAQASYRQVSRQFGAAAGAVRAAGGASRFRSGANTWCVYGYHLQNREGGSVDRMSFPTGGHFIIAAGDEGMTDLDLYLADGDLNVRQRDIDTDAYPMLEFDGQTGIEYRVRVEVERARRPGLVLLGLLER